MRNINPTDHIQYLCELCVSVCDMCELNLDLFNYVLNLTFRFLSIFLCTKNSRLLET